MIVRVHGGAPLRGRVTLPADLAVAQRVLAIASLCSHATRIEGRLPEAEPMARVLRELGVVISREADSTRIEGVGVRGLSAPSGALDAGTSPLAFAITAALLSGQPFGTRVLLETSEQSPAAAIAAALRARGAMIAEGKMHAAGARGSEHASLAVAPLCEGEALRELEHVLPAPDPLVKTALLFSGLYATGPTTVGEPLLSADHTERWLTAAGVPIRRLGSMAGFDPGEHTGGLRFDGAPTNASGERVLELPGDTTFASLIALIATAVPDSDVRLQNVGWNPTRTGVLDALRLNGARLSAAPHGDGNGHEPVSEARIAAARLRGGAIDAELLVRSGEAASLLAAIGAVATRGATLYDAALCPVLQPSPWTRLSAALGAFGVETLPLPDHGLRIESVSALAPAHFDVLGSPALGLLALALALIAGGQSVLEGMPALDEQWPGLLGVLTALGARIEVEG